MPAWCVVWVRVTWWVCARVGAVWLWVWSECDGGCDARECVCPVRVWGWCVQCTGVPQRVLEVCVEPSTGPASPHSPSS